MPGRAARRPQPLALTTARFIVGMVVACLLWWHFTPAYDLLLGRAAAPILRRDARLADLAVMQNPDKAQESVTLYSANGVFPSGELPASQLTYNFILFVALLASFAGLFRMRTMGRIVIALLILFATHLLTFVISAEALYATAQGVWSEIHYGPMAARVWLGASVFLRLVGLLAIAFLCWLYVIRKEKSADVAL